MRIRLPAVLGCLVLALSSSGLAGAESTQSGRTVTFDYVVGRSLGFPFPTTDPAGNFTAGRTPESVAGYCINGADGDSDTYDLVPESRDCRIRLEPGEQHVSIKIQDVSGRAVEAFYAYDGRGTLISNENRFCGAVDMTHGRRTDVEGFVYVRFVGHQDLRPFGVGSCDPLERAVPTVGQIIAVIT